MDFISGIAVLVIIGLSVYWFLNFYGKRNNNSLPPTFPLGKSEELSPQDSDRDGLTDVEEAELGSNPHVVDSDLDRIPDGDEVRHHGTNPAAYDSDNDGIDDKREVLQGTDPNAEDTDQDGLTDHEEINETGTDPNRYDTDRDGKRDTK